MAFADKYMKDPATAPLCEVKPGSVVARGSLEAWSAARTFRAGTAKPSA